MAPKRKYGVYRRGYAPVSSVRQKYIKRQVLAQLLSKVRKIAALDGVSMHMQRPYHRRYSKY